jgi:hypothetical protein
VIRELAEFIAAALGGLAGVAAAFLPSRWWGAFPNLPIGRALLPAAILTLGVGIGVGVDGFLDYGQRAADALATATLDVGSRQAAGAPPGTPEITTAAPVAISALSPVAFLLFTPLGWLAMYLTLSGAVRAISAVVDDPVGDPVLTLVDRLASGGRRRTTATLARLARERQEGPEVPDRLFTGEWAGLAGVDLVVVSSRRKPDWTAGTFVITDDGWYTLGEPYDLRLPEGLRTVYPLTRQTVVEVLRRGVSYELPPLSRARRPGVRS